MVVLPAAKTVIHAHQHAVLEGLQRIWRRPVLIRTKVEEKTAMLRYDGKDHTTRS